MKQLIIPLIINAAAVFSGAAIADTIRPNTESCASVDIKWAAPSQTSPGAESEADPETELMLLGAPDLENRPKR